MAQLTLRDVKKSYGEVQVIHGASLDVADGEFVVLVGPSGCGKSTLLRMIAGLEEITAGEVEIDGDRVNHVPASDRGLAMVFQSYALYPHMTVRQNMAFGLENTRMPKAEIEGRVSRAAEMLRITDYLHRRPKQLSGGQRQRVAIGRAIVRDPKIFLFDEPLSNLDAELRVAMRKELAALHHEIGGTMIYVTHDQTEAMTLADRIVVLNGGRIEQIGTPLELYNRPANLFVAGFIGSPRMNLLTARVEGVMDGTTSLRIGAATVALPFPLAVAGGASVTVGARPEHLDVVDPGTGAIDVAVDLAEQLGGETYLYASTSDGELPQITLHQLGQRPAARGEALGIALRPDFVHVFDADGDILRHGPGSA
ncbi:MAG: sn-glycerol-3-phosphate ABC transporter ATP-binding protein UgpC [Pseudomonadota bacterium]